MPVGDAHSGGVLGGYREHAGPIHRDDLDARVPLCEHDAEHAVACGDVEHLHRTRGGNVQRLGYAEAAGIIIGVIARANVTQCCCSRPATVLPCGATVPRRTVAVSPRSRA